MTDFSRPLRAAALMSILTAFSVYASNAHAFKDGNYTCKNTDASLPANVYKIQAIHVAPISDNVPFVDLTTYSREEPQDPTSPVIESHLKGIATVWSDGVIEGLMLGSVRMVLRDGQPSHCESK